MVWEAEASLGSGPGVLCLLRKPGQFLNTYMPLWAFDTASLYKLQGGGLVGMGRGSINRI